MKKVIFTLLAAFVLLAAFSGCSKKGAEKIIGKWKISTEMPNVEFTYEFTPTKMIGEVKGSGIEPQKIEMSYTIKSDDGTNVIFEAIQPVTNQKGDFKLTITDNKIKMIDPDGQPVDLTRM